MNFFKTQTIFSLSILAGFFAVAFEVEACCKVCTTGKACGNSCISASYTCHQPPGCACNSGSRQERPRPTPTPAPRYSRTSGARPASLTAQGIGSECAYIDGAWKVGRILKNGNFLPLRTEIRNVTYLKGYDRGSQKVSYTILEKQLKQALKKKSQACISVVV